MIAVETRKCSKCGVVHPLTEGFSDGFTPLSLEEWSVMVTTSWPN